MSYAFFDTSIALLNASGTPTTERLTFQTASGQDVVHDVPLLFEKGLQSEVDNNAAGVIAAADDKGINPVFFKAVLDPLIPVRVIDLADLHTGMACF